LEVIFSNKCGCCNDCCDPCGCGAEHGAAAPATTGDAAPVPPTPVPAAQTSDPSAAHRVPAKVQPARFVTR
jgi:hypothetical protein